MPREDTTRANTGPPAFSRGRRPRVLKRFAHHRSAALQKASWRRMAGRQPRVLQILGAIPGPQRLRAVLHRLPAPQGRHLSGQRLRRESGSPVRARQGGRSRARPGAHRPDGRFRWGHLAALVGLAPDQFTTECRGECNYAVSANVKAVIGFYGAYDMLAQWQHDQIARPRAQITEKCLGWSPMQNRRAYFDSSPMSYATTDRNRARFLLVHGTADDVVDPTTQSQAFQNALNQAGIYVRRLVIPGAGHFWASDPFDAEIGSYGATAAPTILRFLEGRALAPCPLPLAPNTPPSPAAARR